MFCNRSAGEKSDDLPESIIPSPSKFKRAANTQGGTAGKQPPSSSKSKCAANTAAGTQRPSPSKSKHADTPGNTAAGMQPSGASDDAVVYLENL